jgi:alkanesulfonate monooxygenase SsuD/methylene tetrahydromethanopterin reductase-like flavin-dependent oxidoreductase (luciferase family)
MNGVLWGGSFARFWSTDSILSLEQIRQQVDALRLAVKQQGRDPFSVKVLVKLTVIVDETEEKAKAKRDEYNALASREGAKVLFGG